MGQIWWQRSYLQENMLYARRKPIWLIMAPINCWGGDLSGGSPIYWVHTDLIKKIKGGILFMDSWPIMQFKYATPTSGLRREKNIVR